ncbi:hypothetical protein A1O3_03553 [Capronia epimyces CBS 606.96]|uniref:RAD52 homolog n=1 Tax=Capronia epimyces CBS 606.96 TaxID=1182542 RepID=W9YAC3_9EURO|nr:uncharacterized protein A1O3_03553 [Capronia epimyces CBS 606.96]EXJ86600.1 hypothetical protein A1O3_03553 [Capronia epimyces CBS 606.96]
MPAVGDQHKPSGSHSANPFEEQKPRITEYTAQEIATLQSRLNQQLGPEYISARAGPGGSRVHYLAAEKAISLANEVFGFNGWSSSIQNIQIDFVDENPQTGKITLGLSVIVRVTLKDGTHHEDIGYGQIENCKGKAAAFEKAKKEGTTDALKRALRNFGNVLGNCVYDKGYLAKVTKMKVGAPRWDPNLLHRHSDFAPQKQYEEVKPTLPGPVQESSTEFDDTFDLEDFEVADFDEIDVGHPDEVALPAGPAGARRGPADGASERMPPPSKVDLTTPSKAPGVDEAQSRTLPPRTAQATGPSNIVPQPLPGQRAPGTTGPPNKSSTGPDSRPNVEDVARSFSPTLSSQHSANQSTGQGSSAAVNPPRIAGFYSAKAAGKIDANNNVIAAIPAAVPKFNPHAESPSIRKTSGVNHSRSIPLKRDLIPDTTTLAPSIINPQSDSSRRVGAPGANSPLAPVRGPSTSAYRPPTRRGPESPGGPPPNAVEIGGGDRALQAARRTPLGDVSNVQHNVTAVTTDGVDAKRQRIIESGQSGIHETANNDPGIG